MNLPSWGITLLSLWLLLHAITNTTNITVNNVGTISGCLAAAAAICLLFGV